MNISDKLNKLIQYALADGVLTEKEKSILLKNAIEEGNDADEFEMYMGALLFEKKEALKREALSEMPPPPVVEKANSNKEGDIKKCPSCGASVKSFQIKCDECGHEFRNLEAVHFTKELETKLINVKRDNYKYEYDFNKALTQIVLHHPLPNTKEDLFEAVTYMSGKVLSSLENDSSTDAYQARALEAINKLLFVPDLTNNMIERLEGLKKEMTTRKTKNSRKSFWQYIGLFGLIVLIYYLIYLAIKSFF